LGLRVLTAGGGDRRGHLRVDHGHAGVEQARPPAGDERCERAAFADGEVPTHVLADEHDTDAESPNVCRPEDAEQRDLPAVNSCVLAHRWPPWCGGSMTSTSSISPSLEDWSVASE